MGIKNEITWGVSGASVVKSLPANAGDTSSVPGPGRSHQEGKKKRDYLFILRGFRWVSGKKICLLMQEIWVRSLGREDPLEKEMRNHSSILAWEILWTVACQATLSMGVTESNTTEHAHLF